MLRGGVRPDRHLHLRQKVADSVLSGDEKMNDSVFVGLYLYLVKGSVRQSSSGVNWKINVEFLMMMVIIMMTMMMMMLTKMMILK